jgi:hypothetical protein
MVKMLAAGLLLAFAGTASAQSEDDYAKYARPVIDQFTNCERPKITKWARTTQDKPDTLADRAIEECREHLTDLHGVMMKAPFAMSDAGATEAIDQMLTGLRPMMLDDIAKVRRR